MPRVLPRYTYVFWYLPRPKKWRGNWILRNLKKVLFQEVKKKKILLKKRNILLHKKGIFIFYMILELSSCRSFTVLSTGVCFPLSYFCYYFISTSKARDIGKMLTLLYQYKSLILIAEFNPRSTWVLARF